MFDKRHNRQKNDRQNKFIVLKSKRFGSQVSSFFQNSGTLSTFLSLSFCQKIEQGVLRGVLWWCQSVPDSFQLEFGMVKSCYVVILRLFQKDFGMGPEWSWSGSRGSKANSNPTFIVDKNSSIYQISGKAVIKFSIYLMLKHFSKLVPQFQGSNENPKTLPLVYQRTTFAAIFDHLSITQTVLLKKIKQISNKFNSNQKWPLWLYY